VDKPWLITLFHEAGLDMTFHVSTLDLILTEPQMEIWHATKQRIQREAQLVRHRASHDAWLIQETYRETALLTAPTQGAQAS